MRTLKQLSFLTLFFVALAAMTGCEDDPAGTDTPNPVTSLIATTVSETSVTLSWNESGSFDSVRISRNGSQIASVAAGVKTYMDEGLAANTSYTYTLVTVKGETKSAEASLSVTTTTGGSTNRVILAGSTGTEDRTLSKDTIYTIVGYYFVQPGTKLIIPAGTRLEGDFETKGAIVTVRASGELASGQIVANGTPSEPIIFTSERPEGQRARGDWGGIVLSGVADLNVPGKTGTGEGGTGAYGPGGAGVDGPKNDDNSGSLRYIRIEYGGTKITTDNEINGLTFNAVGNGTTVEYIQSHMIADDGFEWFGGTVNAKYLVSSGNDDDAFDMDFGYSGNLQFLFAIQAADKANNGFEIDNDGDGSNNQPYTSATCANVTLIGNNASGNAGFYLRRNNKLKIHNALVVNFPTGLRIDGDGCANNAKNGELYVKNSVVTGTSEVYKVTGSSVDLASTYSGWSNKDIDPQLAGIDFANPNPIPGNAQATSMPFEVQGSFFTNAPYAGAFSTGNNWISGWTNFQQK